MPRAVDDEIVSALTHSIITENLTREIIMSAVN